ncbi:hypothetical protein GOODEAATRI_027598 [Goodea atripinnis]|uniref:Uncharacterized protein n=1 Tax=Goodea atripinnis TaxID=208336 RepID=A0ABV0PHJ9_9TELE
MRDALNSPSCFFFVSFRFLAKGQLEGYSDYGSAVFKAGCYLMDLLQSDTADPGKGGATFRLPSETVTKVSSTPSWNSYWMTAF